MQPKTKIHNLPFLPVRINRTPSNPKVEKNVVCSHTEKKGTYFNLLVIFNFILLIPSLVYIFMLCVPCALFSTFRLVCFSNKKINSLFIRICALCNSKIKSLKIYMHCFFFLFSFIARNNLDQCL